MFLYKRSTNKSRSECRIKMADFKHTCTYTDTHTMNACTHGSACMHMQTMTCIHTPSRHLADACTPPRRTHHALTYTTQMHACTHSHMRLPLFCRLSALQMLQFESCVLYHRLTTLLTTQHSYIDGLSGGGSLCIWQLPPSIMNRR